ncbi:MAG: hypothetical protein PSX36_01395 [bacterium]|nr:hypothetical protein [bacterium]
MKTLNFYALAISALVFAQSCTNPDPKTNAGDKQNVKAEKSKSNYTAAAYNNTKGFSENGEIIKNFYCPDAQREFPPIELASWNHVSAVNGRLPSYEETMNGTAIHHYGERENRYVKPYAMELPKLARFVGATSKIRSGPVKGELVVVIQIVKTPLDTIVGYRFLTGGVGGSKFSDFQFLTEAEVNALVAN